MKVLLVKAQMLQQDYVVLCLKAGREPERVDINGRWLRRFCHEYRLAVRQPNRKFKVPRWVLGGAFACSNSAHRRVDVTSAVATWK